MPNGQYELKVKATDKLSNIASEAISIEKISDPFDIDNDRVGRMQTSATQRFQCVVILKVLDRFSYKWAG